MTQWPTQRGRTLTGTDPGPFCFVGVSPMRCWTERILSRGQTRRKSVSR